MPRLLDPETFPRRLVPVLRGILDGKHNREIADACGLTEHTVESYCSEIYSILECDGRGGLMRMALRGQLGSLDKLGEVSG